MARKPDKKMESKRKPKGAPKPGWTTETIRCPEGDYEARLLLEWDKEGKRVLKGISCDNPNFSGLDNWDCRWSCWEKIMGGKK